jgi:Phage tail protein (Tail_P2_I)
MFSSKEMIDSLFRLSEKETNELENFRQEPVRSVEPYLVLAYRLEEIHSIVKDHPEFKARGFLQAKEWLKARGTVKALKVALAWIGFSNVEIRRGILKHWYCYQIGLKGEYQKKIAQIKKVAELSAPLRTKLELVYTLGDREMLILSTPNKTLNKEVLSTDLGQSEF